jgi:hypothetical protein
MMKAGRLLGILAVATGVLGAAFAVWALHPLPSTTDIYDARNWGVGAGDFVLIFGFPLSIVAMPLAIALHPFPLDTDASGAGFVAATVAGIVGVNWAAWAAVGLVLIRMIRRRLAPVSRVSRPRV